MNSSFNQGSCCEANESEVPRSFTRRLILLVNLVFLVTMLIFLSVSFMSERTQHYDETFAHLEETLGVISLLPAIAPGAPAQVVRELESRLSEHTGVAHRLFVVVDGQIAASSDEELFGRDYEAVGDFVPYSGEDVHRWIVQAPDIDWMTSFRAGDDADMYLMRARNASEHFVSQFMAFHGVHIVITVLAFILMLKFLAERYVRKPIEQLARHVERVEMGEFRTATNVSGDDEFAWLAERFTRMGTKLKTTVERLVRAEKYSSVSAITFRVARELKRPLDRMERHILELEGVAQQEPDLRRLANQMRKDRENVIRAVQQLGEIEPPEVT